MSSASARLSRLNPGGWARIRQHKWAKIHGHSHPNSATDCPSTPAAPWLAFTFLKASQISRFGMSNGFALSTELLPLLVGSGARLNNAVPSVQSHYRTLIPTTNCSAPVPRFGTLILTVSAARISPLASGRQVLTFHTRAWSGFAPPTCRMPLGQSSGQPPSLSREKIAPPVSTSPMEFRHVINGSLRLASPDHT